MRKAGVSMMPGLVSRLKDLRFYPNTNGQPSEGFEALSDRIRIFL